MLVIYLLISDYTLNACSYQFEVAVLTRLFVNMSILCFGLSQTGQMEQSERTPKERVKWVESTPKSYINPYKVTTKDSSHSMFWIIILMTSNYSFVFIINSLTIDDLKKHTKKCLQVSSIQTGPFNFRPISQKLFLCVYVS